jgi:glutamate-1-semialdehyde 2,1-aminomutase
MQRDGWWLPATELAGKARQMRLQLLKEMVGSLIQVPTPIKNFYAEIMQRKHDDHVASHSNLINQFFHLLSSSVFIYCYGLIFFDLTQAMCLGLAALFVRQFGHAVLEPPCHDKEELLLGFTTRSKTLVVLGYLVIPVLHFLRAGTVSLETLSALIPTVAWQWFLLTIAVVLGHVLYLMWTHGFRSSMIWWVKLATDPFTDIAAYYTSPLRLFPFTQTRKGEVA